MNLLHDHPSQDVRNAMIRLLDALTTWNRSTGRSNIVIVKDTSEGGIEWRSLDGSPVPNDLSDQHLLESFDALKADQPNPPPHPRHEREYEHTRKSTSVSCNTNR